MKIERLRKQYPKFFYKGYSYKLRGRDLHISFDFRVPAYVRPGRTSAGKPPDIRFHPSVIIKGVRKKDIEKVEKNALDNLVFHLGMMELPSYWKTTCSPRIIVEAGMLNTTQIAWWKNLFIQGLGEFFYNNKIDFTKPNFLTITSGRVPSRSEVRAGRGFGGRSEGGRSPRILVPVGGGKDSAVTLELLKNMDIQPFVLNPKRPQLVIIRKAGGKNPITVLRTIDPKLLELNRKGFLNGHTPFSAYLAFLTALVSALFGFRYVALSNERSSNEGNMRYRGKVINHQYSKSFDFEQRFRRYSKRFLLQELEYFSFLRPLSELQIARIFARFPKYFPVFLSCNRTRSRPSTTLRINTWCGACAKCLFVYVILSPFVAQKTLEKIFGKNLLKDKRLKPLMDQLTGKRGFKPFECVGTPKEVKAALSGKTGGLLRSWDKRNFVPPALSRLLKAVIDGGKGMY